MANETKAEMQARHDREMLEAHDEITRGNHRNEAMRAALADGERKRDLLRGFIFREIPLRLADLPAPIATALGVHVPTKGDS